MIGTIPYKDIPHKEHRVHLMEHTEMLKPAINVVSFEHRKPVSEMVQRHDGDGLFRVSPAELMQLAEDAAEKTAQKAVLKMADLVTLSSEEILFIKNLNYTAKTTKRQAWMIFVGLLTTSAIIAIATAVWMFIKSKVSG